jgi:O-methyltransferase involved in polyketide biosynthesis
MLHAMTERISPTAHFTGYVWFRNQLGHPALATRTGRVLYHSLRPALRAARVLGAPALDDILTARHRSLEQLLVDAIDGGRVGQVVEIAAGLSPRGYRLMRRFGGQGLVYVEGDLPEMAARKRARLASMGGYRPGHHVVEIDALRDIGPGSLAQVGGRLLDPGVGTAVVTEGLVNYFSRAAVTGMWARIARFLARFPYGMYAGDIVTRDDIAEIPGARAFSGAVAAFTRGPVHFHFADGRAVEDALMAAGYQRAACRTPAERGQPLTLSEPEMRAPVHVIHASMRADDPGDDLV